MQINLPSQSCIRDSQEADTPTIGRSCGLWQRHGGGEGGGGGDMFNAAGKLCCTASTAVSTRGIQKESNKERESHTEKD